mmetsp:Transcript_44095/g.100737  ORF Transcript_44095/g.100737 Transcript_44095/m.100737 type:complete len:641 (-) Transcript_44095:137-2059(-)
MAIGHTLPTAQVCVLLNRLARMYDTYLRQCGAHRIGGAQGDALVVCGHDWEEDHAERILTYGKLVVAAAATVKIQGTPVRFQFGVHTGPCWAALVLGGGATAPRYMFIGETIDNVKAIAQTGVPGRLHISDTTREEIMKDYEGSGLYDFAPRGVVALHRWDEDEDVVKEVITKTWLLKESSEEDLSDYTMGEMTSCVGGNADQVDGLVQRVTELEAELAAAKGQPNTDGEAVFHRSCKEQLQRGYVTTSQLIGLVDPLENLIDTLQQVLGKMQDDDGSRNQDHPVIQKIVEVEAEVQQLSIAVESAVSNARLAQRSLRETQRATGGLARGVSLGLVDQLEGIVTTILEAVGGGDSVEALQVQAARETRGDHPLIAAFKDIEEELDDLSAAILQCEERCVSLCHDVDNQRSASADQGRDAGVQVDTLPQPSGCGAALPSVGVDNASDVNDGSTQSSEARAADPTPFFDDKVGSAPFPRGRSCADPAVQHWSRADAVAPSALRALEEQMAHLQQQNAELSALARRKGAGDTSAECEELAEALVVSQSDVRHLQLDLEFHQAKLEEFLVENDALQEELHKARCDCITLRRALEAKDQQLRHCEIETQVASMHRTGVVSQLRLGERLGVRDARRFPERHRGGYG